MVVNFQPLLKKEAVEKTIAIGQMFGEQHAKKDGMRCARVPALTVPHCGGVAQQ